MPLSGADAQNTIVFASRTAAAIAVAGCEANGGVRSYEDVAKAAELAVE